MAVAGLVITTTVAVMPGASSAEPTRTDPRANTLGIQVVRFAHGTSPAAMRQSVERAGGEVLTDLSKIGALAVPGRGNGFAGRLATEPSVRAVWLDRVTTLP